LYVVSGTGKAVVAGKEKKLQPGSLLLIEASETHEIMNTGSTVLRTLNFYAPPAY
jgi:mannose-6-phosphate isomerase-like protein (cupin superfamily)